MILNPSELLLFTLLVYHSCSNFKLFCIKIQEKLDERSLEINQLKTKHEEAFQLIQSQHTESLVNQIMLNDAC